MRLKEFYTAWHAFILLMSTLLCIEIDVQMCVYDLDYSINCNLHIDNSTMKNVFMIMPCHSNSKEKWMKE